MVSAFSIGTGKRSSEQRPTNQFVPGPGSYNPIKKQKLHIFPNRLLESEQETEATYWHRSHQVLARTTAKSKSSKRQLPSGLSASRKHPRHTPASRPGQVVQLRYQGAYNPKASTMVRALPRYSMGQRLSDSMTFGNRAPGPGAYESKSTVLGVPSSKFPLASRNAFNDANRTPGPGTYIKHRPSSAGPRFGFGTSQRDGAYEDKRQPGPGTYELRSDFNEHSRKGFSMLSRKQDLTQSGLLRVPGPGSYNPEKQQKQHPPAYKIGTQNRDGLSKESVRTPGPGTYEAHYEFQRPSSAHVRIGSAQRRPLTEHSQYFPGPGQYHKNPLSRYDIPTRVGEGPKIPMIGTKYDAMQRQLDGVPGPGQYNPSVNQVRMRPQSAKIGTGGRSDFGGSRDAPGVGNYNIRGKAEGPQWGFGSMTRQPLASTNDVPGPGIYNIKPMFADVPKYLMNNAPKYQ